MCCEPRWLREVQQSVMEEARMDPSELNLQANPAENQENWIPGMSVGRGTPNIPGNRPLFLGVGAPNIGWQNLAGTAIAGGSSPITRSAVFSGCSTSMLNAMHESSTLRATLSGSMSRASEQHVGPSIRPSCNLPAGCTQVPISILVFHRRLTGRESRPQLPLSHTFVPAPALPDVSEDSKNGASTQVAQSDFLSLGRESNIVASDMAMNPTALVTPDKYNSEHSPVHFQPNGLEAEASKIVIQGEDSQQSEAAAVICDSHSKLESAIPANTDETQGQHPEESTGLLAEGATNDNMHKYQRTQKRPKIQINQSDHTDLSTPVVFKERTLTQIEKQISGAEKIETFNNEKEETPARKAKPRRKKHRPKVICEDKPAKKQKPAIMMPEAKPPSQKAKRSYVRKKRNLSSPEKCLGSVSDQSISVETGNADRNRSASVRRRLQFELEEQGVQGDQSSMGNSWHHKQEKLVHAKSSLCSVAKSAVQIGNGLQVDMENSLGGLTVGRSCKLNKLLDEYIHLPEVAPNLTQELSPASSGGFSRELARKQDNVGSTHDPDATRMSGLCIEERREVTIMEGNNKDLEMNYSNIDGFEMCCSATSLSEIESTKSQTSKVSKVEKKNHTQHNDSESSLTGTQDSIILRTAAEMLAFCQAGGIKKKRSVRVRRNSFVPTMDIERNTLQASSKLPQSCMEALYESSCIKFMTKKRSQKARLHSPSSIQPNMDQKNTFFSGSLLCGGSNGSKGSEGTFRQTSPQAPDFKRINLDIYCEVPERSSANTSTVPYMDYLQGVASKLKFLDLNTEHLHRTEMHSSMTTSVVVSFGGTGGLSNALIPYVGGVVFPYERPLHLVKKQRPRAKVNLDLETTRVWNLLTGKAADPIDGTDVEKERWWQQEREVFQRRAISFIARMRLVQGDRHFSPWKGSVVDSVVGVFLTQNVADHLSSSAYMALAASFPPGSVNSSCKDDITTQGNEEIISMNAVGNKNMFDYFGNGARPDRRVNFEELSITYEKIHMETEDNASAYELTKDENYSLYSKASNGSFFNHQGTEIDHKVQQYPEFSSVELTTSTKSPQEIQFQKEMSSSQSVITSETIIQSRLSLSSGIEYAPRNFVGGIGFAASQQLGSSFDYGNSLAGNDSTTNEMECQSIKTAAINDDVGEHGMPSSSMMYPFISIIDHRQLDVRNEPYMASTSPNSTSGSASPHLKNGTIEKKISLLIPFDTHAAEWNGNEAVETTLNIPKTGTELPVKLHYDKSTSFEASVLQEHESLSATGGMIAETASRADESTLKSGFPSYNGVPDTAAHASRRKKTKTTSKKNADNFDWDKLRRQACNNSHMKERIFERRDSVDWEAVRRADVQRISHVIRERGMNNVLAERIQNFLNRLVRNHGSIDLEWLRDIPPDSARDYLLSIRGLGLKSVECVRLLTLHHLAFPVDTNVGRICVRLGWVPIQPLPESLQLHLLELYPVLETIQKYLWPRLCKLDQQTLYELHYQMITFGKVFCTKSRPNCNACPMRSECKHFASAFASARLALPAPQEKSLVKSSNQFDFQNGSMPTPNSTPLPRLEGIAHARNLLANNSKPIIEEPASPREEDCPETLENDIEDFDEDTGEIPTIKLNMEAFAQNLENCVKESNMDLQSDDIAKALVAISTEAASIPVPKLKNVHRLRTEHYVYELPDSHPLVQQLGLDQREPDDPSPYLLTIWMPDEINEMSKPPKSCCDSQMKGVFCNNEMCHYCMPERENQSRYVRGTILVPCRTAMRGSFPLNGTYFQVNEVFADHKSSHNPIHVARAQLWNLQRRIVYFGTSVPTIFKGLTTEEIQHCFWRGFVCVRGFDMETRAPRPLCPHLHLAASKLPKSRKTSATDQRL